VSVDLSTDYLGLKLKNPLVASASPLTSKLDSLRRLQDAGAAAAVMHSLFEEQIVHEEIELDNLYEQHANAFAESLGYFPEQEDYHTSCGDYLKTIEDAKRSLSIPIIGSLNGSSKGGWVRYAKSIEEAGADALELNIYFVPTDQQMSSSEVEDRYCELLAAVKESLKIPLAVKIGPFFSGLPHFADRLASAGADGLVLFNRFLEPDIDLDELVFEPNLILSSRAELRLSLRWLAILRDQLSISLAATSGVHETEDVVKALLAGADITMMATVLLQRGTQHLAQMLQELQNWLEEREYESVEQLKGSMSRIRCSDPSQLERANYMKALVSYTDAV
jgi:dihydroorotate dehydrogenase (fumarate)